MFTGKDQRATYSWLQITPSEIHIPLLLIIASYIEGVVNHLMILLSSTHRTLFRYYFLIRRTRAHSEFVLEDVSYSNYAKYSVTSTEVGLHEDDLEMDRKIDSDELRRTKIDTNEPKIDSDELKID